MLLFIHVFVALVGLGASTYSYLQPTRNKLMTSATLLAGTLLSGSLLVMLSHSSIISACLSGVIYSGICLVAMGLGWKKMAIQNTDR